MEKSLAQNQAEMKENSHWVVVLRHQRIVRIGTQILILDRVPEQEHAAGQA